MSVSRRLAPSKRSSARASSSRAALAASKAARASRSASASALSAAARRSAQARRAASALATSPIRALRFSAKICGAFSSSARSRLASAMRWSSVAIWLCAPSRRSIQPALSVASAASRRSASSASRTIACCSARTSASLARLPVMSSRTAASLLSSSAAGASAASARSASALAALASSRLAVRRVRASASADSRAAWRLRSRSRARVSAFGVAGGIEGRLRGVERARLPSTSARAVTSSPSISAKRLRCARRRAAPVGACAAATIAVPAPQIAFARDQPLAGLERRGELGAGLAIDHADLRQPAGELRRRLDEARQRLGAFRQSRIAGVDRRLSTSASAPRHRPARRDRRPALRPAPSRSLCRPRHGRSPAATDCASPATASGRASWPRSPAAARAFRIRRARRARLPDRRAHCCARLRRRPRRLPPR